MTDILLKVALTPITWINPLLHHHHHQNKNNKKEKKSNVS
jgi:hypothetical protein